MLESTQQVQTLCRSLDKESELLLKERVACRLKQASCTEPGLMKKLQGEAQNEQCAKVASTLEILTLNRSRRIIRDRL